MGNSRPPRNPAAQGPNRPGGMGGRTGGMGGAQGQGHMAPGNQQGPNLPPPRDFPTWGGQQGPKSPSYGGGTGAPPAPAPQPAGPPGGASASAGAWNQSMADPTFNAFMSQMAQSNPQAPQSAGQSAMMQGYANMGKLPQAPGTPDPYANPGPLVDPLTGRINSMYLPQGYQG